LLHHFTCTGVYLSVVVPSPNAPMLLLPQAQTVPSFFKAIVCFTPAAIAMTSVRPITCTGVYLLVVVPSPNSPEEFHPQTQTVPSFFKATVLNHAAAIAVIPVMCSVVLPDGESLLLLHAVKVINIKKKSLSGIIFYFSCSISLE